MIPCCCVSRLIGCSICGYPRLVLLSCPVLVLSCAWSWKAEEDSLDRKVWKDRSANVVIDAVGLVAESCSGSIEKAR